MPEREIPAELKCPITYEIMRDPVKTSCNHTFDRAAIINWLGYNRRCPLCRAALSPDQLIPNVEIARRLPEFADLMTIDNEPSYAIPPATIFNLRPQQRPQIPPRQPWVGTAITMFALVATTIFGFFNTMYLAIAAIVSYMFIKRSRIIGMRNIVGQQTIRPDLAQRAANAMANYNQARRAMPETEAVVAGPNYRTGTQLLNINTGANTAPTPDAEPEFIGPLPALNVLRRLL